MTVEILQGDALAQLRTLPSDHFHCVVSSPPYHGLRDYGVEGQIGLEPTLEEWTAKLVAVFREVRRVLRHDGCAFVNLGDSYASAPNGRSAADTKAAGNDDRTFRDKPVGVPAGLKAKDLVGQPWMLAFALRADGWWLRGDYIWAKPNPMPESINGKRWERHRIKGEDGEWELCPGCPKCIPNDGLVLRNGSWRSTKAHEYVFMLSKSEDYYCDAEAVREKPQEYKRAGGDAGRNLRSVWTIATDPLPSIVVDGEKLDHFASYPVALARRCILAGTSAKGCCPECGAPWARQVEIERSFESGSGRSGNMPIGKNGAGMQGGGATLDIRRGPTVHTTTTGWRPTCSCAAADPAPCRVLDPFGGSGRTALAAEELGRDCTLIELSAKSCAMARAQLERAKARRFIGDAERTPVPPGQLALL